MTPEGWTRAALEPKSAELSRAITQAALTLHNINVDAASMSASGVNGCDVVPEPYPG